MVEIQYTINQGSYCDVPPCTVVEFRDVWLNSLVFHKLGNSCQYQYLHTFDHDVMPILGTMQLEAIRARHIEGVFKPLLKRGLLGSSLLYVHRVMMHFFTCACDLRYLTKNPLTGRARPALDDTEVLPFDRAEADLISAACKGTCLELASELGLYAGLRRCEAAGLSWSDINFRTRGLTVRQNLVFVPKVGYRFKSPKTRSSRRTIKMPLILVQALAEARKRLLAEYSALGQDCPAQVCALPGGKLLTPIVITKGFSKLLKRLELREPPGEAGGVLIEGEKSKYRTFHSLRHTHATLLLQDRVPVKVVSVRLGHSSVVTTLRTYAHVMPGDDLAAADAVDRMFHFDGETDVDNPCANWTDGLG